MNTSPIFIGGPDRCGKTTLRAFLVSHPNISIPAVGSNMWTYFFGQYGDLKEPENFNRCLEAMIHYKHVAFLKPDPDRIRREFWKGEPTYARLFALFQQHHAEREGKPRWGDQTGLIERYAGNLFRAYPGAIILHMIRDPRDRYEASLTLWPMGKGRAGGATARWLYSVGLGNRNQRMMPKNYMFVIFENLIVDPESTLKEICSFIGEEYTPIMLSMDGAEEFRAQLSNGWGDNLLSEAYIGKYRGTVPKYEIAFMQALAKKRMREFGYSSEQIVFSFKERIQFWIYKFPQNLFRFIAWRSREALQQNFPGKFGRKFGVRHILKDVEE